MKIIHILPSFDIGGAETMCEKLMYELVNLNCEVFAVSLYSKETDITRRLENNGIRIVYLDKKRGLDFSQIWKLYKLFRTEKPNVVHTHLYALKYVAIASIMAKINVRVHTIHSVAQKESEKVSRLLNRVLFKTGLVVPVSLSKAIQETVIEEYNIKEEKTPYIYNGMPIDEYIPKKDYSFGKKIKILHVGRFSPVKNHKRLVETFEIVHKKYPMSQLLLAGGGELENEIKLLVKEKGLESAVEFKGVVSDIGKLMETVDIFCLTSEYEGISMAVIEAMASALPIVSTGVGGINDMIESGESGILCKCDAQEIAKELIKMIEDEHLRQRMGQAALLKSKDFSAEKTAKEYLRLYTKIGARKAKK